MTSSRPLIEPTAPDERLSAEDMASRRADEFLADALAVQARQAGGVPAPPRGICAWCAAPCGAGRVYCDDTCRTADEDRRRTLARQGRAV